MSAPVQKALMAGDWQQKGQHGTTVVTAPYDGAALATVPLAGPADASSALDVAAAACARAPVPPASRSQILRDAAAGLRSRAEELARLLALESGNPVVGARVEVERSARVLEECAEEARRITGELIPVDAVPGSEDRLAFTMRFPMGIVGAITPFNGPLLSPAHKVGAALAAGNAAVLKPPPFTPLGSLELAKELTAAGLPHDLLHVLVGGADVGEALVADERTAMVTFTGSTAVGLQIRRQLGLRPALLELGGNAPMIVHDDADVAAAASAAVPGAFGFAGQVCISVQRLLVHRAVFDEFLEHFVALTDALRLGDPLDPDTDVGPMISIAAADRAEQTTAAAVHAGGTVLTGGTRKGQLVAPTVVVGADPASSAVCEEAFAPLVYIDAYDDITEAFAHANETPYGLQASLYTASLDLAMEGLRTLRFGGVIVNDTPRYRVDLMPYGGVKASGGGREAPRYSIRAMTEERLVVLRGTPP